MFGAEKGPNVGSSNPTAPSSCVLEFNAPDSTPTPPTLVDTALAPIIHGVVWQGGFRVAAGVVGDEQVAGLSLSGLAAGLMGCLSLLGRVWSGPLMQWRVGGLTLTEVK
jgi:hypothetical protein